MTFVDGVVAAKRFDATVGAGLVEVDLVMTNQDGSVMAKGKVEIQLAA